MFDVGIFLQLRTEVTGCHVIDFYKSALESLVLKPVNFDLAAERKLLNK